MNLKSHFCASSILAPHTSSLKWSDKFCLTGSHSLKVLGINDIWIAEWILNGYKNHSGFYMRVATILKSLQNFSFKCSNCPKPLKLDVANAAQNLHDLPMDKI